MRKKLDKQQLQGVLDKLNAFEGSSPYDIRELETSMEALATQIFLLMVEAHEPTSLAEAVQMLPIESHKRKLLLKICEDIQGVLEIADYDTGDDEDNYDLISQLKADFHSILEPELKKLQNAK